MNAFIVAVSLMASTPSPSPAVVSPQLLVGEWRSENYGGTYHFRANGTYYWHAWDMGDEGRWRLRGGNTIELLSGDARGKTTREVILIDRVVHETLYVRTKYQKEVWLKQPGP